MSQFLEIFFLNAWPIGDVSEFMVMETLGQLETCYFLKFRF